MPLFREKEKNSSDYPPEIGYDPEGLPAGDGYGYDDDLGVRCPPHTTERKLVTRIDLHVIPFLCIMYLLAFLDRGQYTHINIFNV